MPKLHIKPTINELDEKINKSLEELDKKPKEEVPPVEEKPQEDKPKSETPPETPSVEIPEEKPEVPKKEEKPEDKPKKKVDYKEKFIASSVEGNILYTKNKQIADAIAKASEVAEPTEEEMIALYPDWEVMSDFERKMAKKDEKNTRKLDAIEEATRDFKDIDAWTKKVDDFLADPQTFIDSPELEGKEEEFRIFSTKPTRRGIDFEDLVASFSYMTGKEVKPKAKGSMFPTGSPGINERPQPKSDKITIVEARRLRVTDYKKYLQYVRESKIELEEI